MDRHLLGQRDPAHLLHSVLLLVRLTLPEPIVSTVVWYFRTDHPVSDGPNRFLIVEVPRTEAL